MPPKAKITKDIIIRTAVELVRAGGEPALNARAVAAALGCSTQPIFSNFDTMEQLRDAVILAAQELYQKYLQEEAQLSEHPAYKAAGMAYIRFAKEEKALFRLLFMRDRSQETTDPAKDLFDQMVSLVDSQTGMGQDKAQLFHFEIWSCVHGFATMAATSYLDIDRELLSRMLTDIYQGLRKQYALED